MPDEFSIWSQENDPVLISLGKGMALGGTGLAAIYGINELRRFIADKLYDKPAVLPEEIFFRDPKAKNLPDEMYARDRKNKRPIKLASYFSQARNFALRVSKNKEIIKLATETETDTILRKFLYGFGVPMGVLGSYKTLNYFRDKEEEARLRSKLREYDVALRGKTGLEAAGLNKKSSMDNSKNIYESLCKNATQKEIELIKMAMDPEINTFIDKQITKIAESEEKGIIQTTKELTNILAAIPKYAPYIFGLGAGVSGLAGYYGTKYYLDPASILKKDILNVPSLVYAIKEKKDKKLNNKEAALINSMAKQINKVFNKQGNFIGEYIKEIASPSSEKVKSDIIEGVEQSKENLKKELLQPSTLGYLALGGGAVAAPGVLAYYLIKEQEKEEKKKELENELNKEAKIRTGGFADLVIGLREQFEASSKGHGWDLARNYADATSFVPNTINAISSYYAQAPAKEFGKQVQKGVETGAGKAFDTAVSKVMSPKGFGSLALAGGAFALPNILSGLFSGGGRQQQQQVQQAPQQFKPPSMAEGYKGFSTASPRTNPSIVPGAAQHMQSSLM